MLNDYINFVPSINPIKKDSEKDLFFIFNDNNIMLMSDGDKFCIPTKAEIYKSNFNKNLDNKIYLGCFKNINCYIFAATQNQHEENFKFLSLREAGLATSNEIFILCSKASQIFNWNINSKYCGKCGSSMVPSTKTRSKICTNCSNVTYPVISPAVIVLITKGKKLLLAHNRNFKNGMYSLISGFLEAGESLEECVRREVYEEVKVMVKDIKYFGNQSWPFPNSHMIAFTAKHVSGTIEVDGDEILDAGWYNASHMPAIPSKLSIARKMIDSFLKRQD